MTCPTAARRTTRACIRAIKQRSPATAVEALTPDFQGVLRDVETVVDSGLEVFAQNVETVRRLTHPVRDPRAGYEQTLAVLAHAKRHRPQVLTKSSLMLGLGETDAEIAECMDDLRAAGVDILTLGQYLRPTVNHLSVERFVTPEQFQRYRAWGLARGFRECVSGPLVRSSYRAEQALAGNNVGLGRQHPVCIAADSTAPCAMTALPSGSAAAPTSRSGARCSGSPRSAAPTPPMRSGCSSTSRCSLSAWTPIRAHVLAPAATSRWCSIDRGGQVTYHGPGQLVVYPLDRSAPRRSRGARAGDGAGASR